MDQLLLTFIEATDEEQSDRSLTHLIDEHAKPIVKEILNSSLHLYVDFNGPSSSQDAGDLFNDIIVNLLSRLRHIKSDPTGDVITDFRSYVAGTAFNACSLYLRQRFPRRSRLKNRLRYLLSHDGDFALWATEAGLLCGFVKWRDKNTHAPRRVLEKIRQDPNAWVEAVGLVSVSTSRSSLSNLLQVFFQWSESPVRLDDLVNVVAEICREKDQADESLETAINLATPGLSFEKILEHQHNLALLWQEICQLPRRQRAALLLNFKDSRGQELASLLPHTRTATIEQIAAALEFRLEEFLTIWNQLPLDDMAIAQMLGATRQQVINLRKCARERLERRMNATRLKCSAG
jgi:RNA polymerase sigma factor (sigma-70 family)